MTKILTERVNEIIRFHGDSHFFDEDLCDACTLSCYLNELKKERKMEKELDLIIRGIEVAEISVKMAQSWKSVAQESITTSRKLKEELDHTIELMNEAIASAGEHAKEAAIWKDAYTKANEGKELATRNIASLCAQVDKLRKKADEL
jgi:hypothetical protein